MLELDYEQGLKQLEESLPRNDFRVYNEFSLLKARLLENLKEQNLYGRDPSNRSEHARIMEALGKLADDLLGIHFIDLCRVETTPYPSSPPHVTPAPQPLTKSTNKPWSGGAEIVLEDETYWLYDPIEESWSSDCSVVQRKAKAQQAQVNRRVWLKQVCIFHPTSMASASRNALKQEGRLLVELEQETPPAFPRFLTTYSTEHSLTIVYTATQGNPLRQIFGLRNTPLDAFSARTLLRSIHSLCIMLGILHRRDLAHRTLTPETILVQNGRMVLQDLGLAARTFEPGEGPAFYQAPEQVPGRMLAVPGPHTDIYQFGMILYHILTGHLPRSPLPDILPATETISQDLYAVLRRAVAPVIKDRWPTIRAFEAALRNTME